MLYAAAYDDGVYKSTDSGKTWARKSKGLGYEGNARVHRVFVHPQSGAVYAVIIGEYGMEFKVPGGLWKSTDGGETWTDLTADLKLMWPAGYFSIHPKDEKIILLSASGGPGCMEQGGVWKTIDGGKNAGSTPSPPQRPASTARRRTPSSPGTSGSIPPTQASPTSARCSTGCGIPATAATHGSPSRTSHSVRPIRADRSIRPQKDHREHIWRGPVARTIPAAKGDEINGKRDEVQHDE